jgi:fatty-acyl-CoA synthase
MASRLAAGLLSSGYRRGDRIAVWGPSEPQWILLEYAICRAGLVIVALNPLYKHAELLHALRAADVRGIFHADQVGAVQPGDVIRSIASELPNRIGIHSFSSDVSELMDAAPAHFRHQAVDPESLFMIQFTSGTTGSPKAAQLSHNAIMTSALNSHRRYGMRSGDRICNGFPLFHVGGSAFATPGAVLLGATALPLRVFKADRTLELLERERCRVFCGVPTMVIAMLEDPSFDRRDLSPLELLVIGGATLPTELLPIWEQRFGAQVINGYGQTESCGATAGIGPGDPADKKANTSGVAFPGVSLKLVDTSGTIVPHGVPGEVCYQGPGRMMGYRDSTPEVETIDADGWLHSGDVATMDHEGFITIVGRAKDMIIRGGENLSPAEIERLILQYPGVSQVAVVGIPDRKCGEEVCAAIKLAEGATPSAEEIRAWCLDRVSRWKVPRYVAFVESLPLTASGKIKKFELRELMVRALSIDGS